MCVFGTQGAQQSEGQNTLHFIKNIKLNTNKTLDQLLPKKGTRRNALEGKNSNSNITTFEHGH